ncbi:MAG: metal ABC transporter permease [Alkalispirochaeta sp.]
MIEAFSVLRYAPVLRGFLVLMLSGAVFPLVGIFVLRLNLITMRFALMHASLLGSAIALAVGANPLLVGMGANSLLVIAIARIRGNAVRDVGFITTFFMVLTIGLAFAIIYRFNVSANDSLQILWGNIYAMTPLDAWLTVVFGGIVVSFVVLRFPVIVAVFFDRDVAISVGVRESLVYTTIVLIVGLTISFVMRLIGALLLDAILILPALMAVSCARSLRGTFIWASVFGTMVALGGFVFAILADLPVSSGVTIFGALLFGGVQLVVRSRTRPIQRVISRTSESNEYA